MDQETIVSVSSPVDVLPDTKAKSLDCQKTLIVIAAVCNLNGKLVLVKFINVLTSLLKFLSQLALLHVQVCVRTMVCAHKEFAVAPKGSLVTTVNTKNHHLTALWSGT